MNKLVASFVCSIFLLVYKLTDLMNTHERCPRCGKKIMSGYNCGKCLLAKEA